MKLKNDKKGTDKPFKIKDFEVTNKTSLRHDKRGTDKLLSVYWFFILFIVAAGIIVMATLFYGKQYDVRELEANILVNKVADCLSKRGLLVDDWEKINNENFLKKCSLNFNVEDTKGWKNDQYYVKIDFNDYGSGPISRDSIVVGNDNFDFACGKGVTCIERKLYTIDSAYKQYIIKIKAIVRKTEKNE